MITAPVKSERLSRAVEAAGLRIGGDRPFDPRVLDERLYSRVLTQGSVGLGDGYMDGWWECDDIEAFFCKVFQAGLDKGAGSGLLQAAQKVRTLFSNPQSLNGALEVGRRHYDLSNELYRGMLDRRMIYSCGYWKDAESLEDAQAAKLDLVCRKLNLQPGQHVLDIGCGWGGFASFAAERYGVRVTGVTISREQWALAKELWAGLPVEFLLQDYRKIEGRFDHIVSIGMFEHAGVRNYRAFFEVARRCLKPEGLFLLHTIGSPVGISGIDPWIHRRIFPNAELPSIAQIAKAVEGLFVVEDLHNFGADYAPTLRAWHANFARNWPGLAERFDERFRRMWSYYLQLCAAQFATRRYQLWQIVLSPEGTPGGYAAVR